MGDTAPASVPVLRERRRLLGGLLALALGNALPLPLVAARAVDRAPWWAWRAFARRHLQDDGRVVDFNNSDLRTTSEGQSYGLFFALLDNDPVTFDRILAWTRRNLGGGRLDLNLPAWLWGRDAEGRWRVLDDNSAADGELWIAYCLIEAGRLWRRPGLSFAGGRLLALIREREVVDLPGFGPTLLPGVRGFVKADRWTLNPCYLPLFILRRFASVDPKGPWEAMAECSTTLLRGSAPAGFAPDWIAWDGKAFVVDPDKGDAGSYDAIRCYLWAGLTDAQDPLRTPQLAALHGPATLLQGQELFPERVQTVSGVGNGTAPVGFSAALIPYLYAKGQPALAARQARRLPTSATEIEALGYYDRVLLLFGQGWLEGRYRICVDGRLSPAWSPLCSARP